MMYKWMFECYDNGGMRQLFVVKAKDKEQAIKKGFERAKKNAIGNIVTWNCRLVLN